MKTKRISKSEFKITAECDCDTKKLTSFAKAIFAENRKRMKELI